MFRFVVFARILSSLTLYLSLNRSLMCVPFCATRIAENVRLAVRDEFQQSIFLKLSHKPPFYWVIEIQKRLLHLYKHSGSQNNRIASLLGSNVISKVVKCTFYSLSQSKSHFKRAFFSLLVRRLVISVAVASELHLMTSMHQIGQQ